MKGARASPLPLQMQAVGGAVGSSERLFLLQLSTARNPLSIRQSPGLPNGEMSPLLGAFALEQGAYSLPITTGVQVSALRP
ncbi:hypothetical protein BJP24_21500 [Aeromonas allosaccharophila]|nr:hypothetical protein BJP24_21500 [Aeromonas allosaccharophila]